MSNRLKKNIGGLKGRDCGSRGKLVPWLNCFRRDEDGAVIAFTLFTLVMFLLMAGIGIDVMRHEMERTRLAAVADAASLAGAAAPNNDAAKEVVRDYLKEDISAIHFLLVPDISVPQSSVVEDVCSSDILTVIK